MEASDTNNFCKMCGEPRKGDYCYKCGQSFAIQRLTLKGIFHEAFHYFTHLDNAFPYTIKQLILSPGNMQREYVNGIRKKYQKPFSMFFICASFAALSLYLINLSLVKYFGTGDSEEALFFHKYWVLLQVCMFPVFATITYLFFNNKQYNYAEIMILQLYTFSFIFLILTVIHLFKYIAPHLQTRYIELPVFVLYTIFTNVFFFNKSSRLATITKSILIITINFFLATALQDILVECFM